MTLPDFSFERKIAKKGFKFIAGVDEVGRGCFAGPVVAACVVFNKQIYKSANLQIRIDDSKKLNSKQRELADKWIRENALAFGVGEASVSQINKLGIKKATEIAFRKAISKAKPDFLLIDAFYIPFVKGLRRKNQLAIIKGDAKSISIAAASIIAKVHRDKLMTKISKNQKLKAYKFNKNNGYGTKEHRDAIIKHGITRFHRKKFVETYLKNSSSSQAQ